MITKTFRSKLVYTLGVGLNRCGEIIHYHDKYNIMGGVLDILAREFGGVTSVWGKGSWIAPNGRMDTETILQFTVLSTGAFIPSETAHRIAQKLLTMADQTAIIVQLDDTVYEISRDPEAPIVENTCRTYDEIPTTCPIKGKNR